ncbi:hypothetical protein HK102_007236 [Quaeritorhiza haematococci]|nr:hypothetical protein HK102_007236 [Quaeritorhiza haematococci]
MVGLRSRPITEDDVMALPERSLKRSRLALSPKASTTKVPANERALFGTFPEFMSAVQSGTGAAPRHVLLSTGNVAKHVGRRFVGQEASKRELLASLEVALYEFALETAASNPNFEVLDGVETSASDVLQLGQSQTEADMTDRETLDVIAKLFIPPGATTEHMVEQACQKIHDFLGTSRLDALIVRWAPASLPTSKVTPSGLLTPPTSPPLSKGSITDALKPLLHVWHELETLHKEGKIASLGIDGLSHDWIEVFVGMVQVKPSIVQVNTTNGLVSNDIVNLSEKFGFAIHVSSDPADILPKDDMDTIVSRYSAYLPVSHTIVDGILSSESVSLSPDWILRYTVFDRTRSVLLDKGYFVRASVE